MVNADLMATHVKLHSTVANIMENLSKQQANALLFTNLSSLVRVGDTKGKSNVLDRLKSHHDFRYQFSKGTWNRAQWNVVPLTINGAKGNDRNVFEYVSDHTPMQTVFLHKTKNPDYVASRTIIQVKSTSKKNPIMVEAGRKAYETRLKNLAAK